MLSEIDIDNGYNRIPLGKESQPFTAFTQPSNDYRWMFTVLIYGIKGAGGFFQRAILRALSDLCDDTKVYIDNVFVHTKTPPDSPWDVKLMKHKEAVCQALNSLHQDNWKVKRAKCNFGYRSLRVLGSLVTGSKRSVDPEKKVDLSKKGRPKTKKQLISLVAFINYLRDYIPAYDRVIGRLYKLQGKKNISEKDWKEAEGDEVLKDVLKALNQGYVLHQPDPTLGPFYIDTDASQFGVGAALYQKTEDDKVRFIGFTSKKFNDAQKSYPAGKRELLALINALNRWRHIVHGYPVIAVVDHKSLTYMKNSVSYMILDWLNFLQRFDLRVVHRPGLKHILPDSLSHLYEMASTTEKEEQEEADTPHVSAKEIPKYPKPPSDLSEPDIELSNQALADAEWVYTFVDDWESAEEPSIPHGESESACSARDEIAIDPSLKEAAVISRRFGASELGKQDPEDNSKRMKIVRDAHLLGPHDSAYKLQQRLFFNLGFYWPKMYQMCRDVCETCDDCLAHNVGKTGFHFAKANPVTSVNDTWGWDILDVPENSSGYHFILLILDFASRKCWLSALKVKDASKVARKLFKLGCRFGFPLSLQSDKDPSFCNEILRALKKLTGIESKWSAPFCPWTNPVVENQAKSTKELLRKVLKGNYSNWHLKVPIIEHCLNSRIIESTKSCADTFYFMRRARAEHENVSTEIESLEEISKRIELFESTILPALAISITDHARKRAAKLNASRTIAKMLSPGDRVMMKVQQRDNKSHERWEGPYMVVKKAEKGYTILNNLTELRSHDVPRECLKRVRDRDDKKGGWWEVRKIEDHKKREDGKLEYLTFFHGYDDPYWLIEDDFNSKNIISNYWKQVRAAAKKAEKKPIEKRQPTNFVNIPTPSPSNSSKKSTKKVAIQEAPRPPRKAKSAKKAPTSNPRRSSRH